MVQPHLLFISGVEIDGKWRTTGVVNQNNTEVTVKFTAGKIPGDFVGNLSEIELLIANVEGVSSVPKVIITNKCAGKYSSNSYNILKSKLGFST